MQQELVALTLIVCGNKSLVGQIDKWQNIDIVFGSANAHRANLRSALVCGTDVGYLMPRFQSGGLIQLCS